MVVSERIGHADVSRSSCKPMHMSSETMAETPRSRPSHSVRQGFSRRHNMRQVLPGWLTSFYPGRTTTDSTSSRSTVGCAQLRQHEARAPRCVTNVLLSLVASTAARAVAVFPLYVGEVWSITNSLFRVGAGRAGVLADGKQPGRARLSRGSP